MLNELIIICAKYLFGISILVFAVFWWSQKSAKKMDITLTFVLSGILALALAKLMGHFIYDARPFVSDHIQPLIAHANDNGFPSDHTLLTALIGFVAFRYSRPMGSILLVLAVAVGASRVAAGIHHPLDIIGAFIIAGAAAVATILALDRFKQSKAKAH